MNNINKTLDFVDNKQQNMKVTFESESPTEIKRLSKADDMAMFIWELVHNGWREFKHSDYEYGKAWDKIHELLEIHGIDIDDICES